MSLRQYGQEETLTRIGLDDGWVDTRSWFIS